MNCTPTFALALAATLVASTAAMAAEELDELPDKLHGVDVQEHLGLTIDHDIEFVDHTGETVTIGDLLEGDVPVMVTLNYYECPMLCSLQLNALTDALGGLDWTAGENFRIVTVSIDPEEGTSLAAAKRSTHLDALGRGDDVGWHFLTGEDADIRRLAAQLGIGYRYDPNQDQWGHPPVVTVLSPSGKITRYLYGLALYPRDLRFALMEAADGTIGTTVDRIILSCFRYDATEGNYSPFVFGIMRLGAAVTVVIVAMFLALYWRFERRHRTESVT